MAQTEPFTITINSSDQNSLVIVFNDYELNDYPECGSIDYTITVTDASSGSFDLSKYLFETGSDDTQVLTFNQLTTANLGTLNVEL